MNTLVKRPARTSSVRDLDIRRLLRSKVRDDHAHEADTLVVEELGLCQGVSRVDLAVINGFFIGYEIKSEQDTLERLPGQAETYNRVLDEVTVVASERHLDRIPEVVPPWWGIAVVCTDQTDPAIEVAREALRNPTPDPRGLVQLLWRDEALQALESLELDRGVRSKPRHVLWARLADELAWEDLHELVRKALKSRDDWQVVQRPA